MEATVASLSFVILLRLHSNICIPTLLLGFLLPLFQLLFEYIEQQVLGNLPLSFPTTCGCQRAWTMAIQKDVSLQSSKPSSNTQALTNLLNIHTPINTFLHCSRQQVCHMKTG